MKNSIHDNLFAMVAAALPDDLAPVDLRPYAPETLWQKQPEKALATALAGCPRINWQAYAVRNPEASQAPLLHFIRKGVSEGKRLFSWHPCKQPDRMGAPRVSIIVPCYNSPEQFEESIGSLTAQTLRDIEIILVDDCSTDDTPARIEALARMDRRIRVIRHEENKGIFMARKTGVAAARGRYVMFMDHDDRLAPEACAVAAKEIAAGYDLVNFGAHLHGSQNADMTYLSRMSRTFSKKERKEFCGGIYNAVFTAEPLDTYLWTKIYLRELVQAAYEDLPDARFVVIEDIYAIVAIAGKARNALLIPDKLYHYNFGGGASTPEGLEADLLKADNVGRELGLISAYIRDKAPFLDFALVNDLYCRILIGNINAGVAPANCYTYWRKYPAILGFDAMFRTLIDKFSYKQPVLTKKLKNSAGPMNPRLETIGLFLPDLSVPEATGLVTGLASLIRSHKCRIVVFTQTRQEHITTRPDGIPIVTISSTGCDEASWYEHYRSFRAALEAHPVDVMLHHGNLSPALLWEFLLLHILNIPVVFHYPTNFGVSYHAPATNFTHHHWDDVVACADAVTCSSILDELYLRANGANAWFLPDPLPQGEHLAFPGPEIAIAGDFVWPGYQLEQALAIFRQGLSSVRDARLCMIGDFRNPEEKTEFLKALADEEIENRVTITGKSRDFAPWLRKCGVLLITSYWEGQQPQLAQALADGIPCVMYEGPLGLARNPGVWHVAQGDYLSASACITHLFTKKDAWQEISDKMRENSRKLDLDAWTGNIRQFLVAFQKYTPLRQYSPRDYREVIRLGAFYAGRKDI